MKWLTDLLVPILPLFGFLINLFFGRKIDKPSENGDHANTPLPGIIACTMVAGSVSDLTLPVCRYLARREVQRRLL